MKKKITEVKYVDVLKPRDRKKEIEQAADKVAETVFYHFTDSSSREKLKAVLIEFAKVLTADNPSQ